MHSNNEVASFWSELEKSLPYPKYITGVMEFNFAEFAHRIRNLDLPFIKNLVNDLFAGNVVIVRGAVSQAHIEYIKQTVLRFELENKPTFFKVLEGCPDFHREVTPSVAGKSSYSFRRIQHLYYFYRWNSFGKILFPIADNTWDLYKTLCGWAPGSFKSSTPKDGLVDRLHIHHYPIGAGEQELHQDPYLAQKMIMGHLLSEKGVGREYESGGIYYLKEDGGIVDVDSELRAGDAYISFPLLVHGVARIDSGSKESWGTEKGRWFMGYYTLYSDHVDGRHTGWSYDSVNHPGNRGGSELWEDGAMNKRLNKLSPEVR